MQNEWWNSALNLFESVLLKFLIGLAMQSLSPVFTYVEKKKKRSTLITTFRNKTQLKHFLGVMQHAVNTP